MAGKGERAADGAALIWCPFPDRDTARGIAAQLLDEKLVACANIVGEVESHFLWQGERSSASETGVLFKTTTTLLGNAVERLGKLHPYDTPAIAGWRADAALPATIAWLSGATQPDE
jgi:periplasmic divalent cation tolerance protein